MQTAETERRSFETKDHGSAEAKSPSVDQTGKPHRAARWPWILGGFVVAASLGAFGYAIFAPKADVTTDDAYVHAHYATIAPRISGQVTRVGVDNTQWARTGQVLATIDDRDFRLALDGAQAQLGHDRAQVQTLEASVASQKMVIAQSEAEVRSTVAQLSFASIDARRYGDLAATGAGTVKNKQQADTALTTSSANAEAAKARLGAARHQLGMIEAQLDAATATVKLDEARRDQAALNLSYTTIRAPVNGMVAARSVQVGDYVSAGTSLMTMAPLDAVYIDANYREVQLAHVAKDQRVSIHVDAYDIDLDGTVVGIPAASGTTFAPIQPDNATGNFTKIVQRLPVRIALAPNQPKAALLRLGMSVETTIHTHFADVTTTPLKPAEQTSPLDADVALASEPPTN